MPSSTLKAIAQRCGIGKLDAELTVVNRQRSYEETVDQRGEICFRRSRSDDKNTQWQCRDHLYYIGSVNPFGKYVMFPSKMSMLFTVIVAITIVTIGQLIYIFLFSGF